MLQSRVGLALSRCEACQRHAAKVIETDVARHGARRRRKECLSCHHRFTEYEIPAAEFKRLTEAASALATIRRALGGKAGDPAPPEPQPVIPCTSCRFATANGCSFEYPEFGSIDAVDCGLFEAGAA